MSPVYWKPRYATRNRLHKAFVKRQAAREAELRRVRTPSLLDRLRRLFRTSSSRED